MAETLSHLASLHKTQGGAAQAETYLKRAVGIWEKSESLESPEATAAMESYADLLRQTDREDEAVQIEKRIQRARRSPEPTIAK